MWTRFRQALAASIDLLLPPACLLCGRLLPAGHHRQEFCPDCLADVSPLPAAHCRRCAQPFQGAASNHLCAACLQRPPTFTRVLAGALYLGSVKEAIHKLKYRNQVALAAPLGQLLGRAVAASGTDFVAEQIVPVPLHAQRLRSRGFNQALELARPLARQLGVPCNAGLLRRIRQTPPQQGLSAAERRSNLRNAFALAADPPTGRLLLVDDVMTTGETVRECCRILTAAGAAEVRVAIVGRV